MIGTSAAFFTTGVIAPLLTAWTSGGSVTPEKVAIAAGVTGLLVFGVGFLVSFFLPEPPQTSKGQPVTLPTGKVRIAYIPTGAAGNFCGSCMHDNALVAALTALGHDALLIPTYTPIRTDEPDMSQPRIFFGGINVYLQQKVSLFRHTPWTLDRL